MLHRLDAYYRPYHATLAGILDRTHARFGSVFHINAHSMKPVGNAMNLDNGVARPDVVLSDREGETTDPAFINTLAEMFRDLGYSVAINHPYKGAELVARHSNPAVGRHSVQVELNRALYLDLETFERSSGFTKLKASLDSVLNRAAAFARSYPAH